MFKIFDFLFSKGQMYIFVLRIHTQISFPASIFLEVVVLQAGAFLSLVLRVVIYNLAEL